MTSQARGHGFRVVAIEPGRSNSTGMQMPVSDLRSQAIAQAEAAAQLRTDKYMVDRVGREMAVIRKRVLVRRLQQRKWIAILLIASAGVSFLFGWTLRGETQAVVVAHPKPTLPVQPIDLAASAGQQFSSAAVIETTNTVTSQISSALQAPHEDQQDLKPIQPTRSGVKVVTQASKVAPESRVVEKAASAPKDGQGGIDVELGGSNPGQAAIMRHAPRATSGVILAEGGVLTLRDGARVSTYRIGEKLPDGTTLKAAEGGQYKSSP